MGKTSKKVASKTAAPARKSVTATTASKTVSTPAPVAARKVAKPVAKTTVKTVPARKNAKTVKALYAVSALTKKSSDNLWVVFPAGNTSKGLVFTSTVSRDTVRNSARKTWGINITETRSRRVKSFRKISK